MCHCQYMSKQRNSKTIKKIPTCVLLDKIWACASSVDVVLLEETWETCVHVPSVNKGKYLWWIAFRKKNSLSEPWHSFEILSTAVVLTAVTGGDQLSTRSPAAGSLPCPQKSLLCKRVLNLLVVSLSFLNTCLWKRTNSCGCPKSNLVPIHLREFTPRAEMRQITKQLVQLCVSINKSDCETIGEGSSKVSPDNLSKVQDLIIPTMAWLKHGLSRINLVSLPLHLFLALLVCWLPLFTALHVLHF